MNINPSSQNHPKNSTPPAQMRANNPSNLFVHQRSCEANLPSDTSSKSYFKRYIDRKDGNGKTSLMDAIQGGRWIDVKVFLAAGADVNISDRYGKRAINYAIQYNIHNSSYGEKAGQFEVIKDLLKHGATVNYKDQSICENTPLHDAMDTLNPKIVKLLLEHGADVNALNGFGKTALCTCTASYKFSERDDIHYVLNLFKIIKILLFHNADINIKSRTSVNILHNVLLAEKDRVLFKGPLTLKDEPFLLVKSEMIKLLLSRGADLDAYVHTLKPVNNINYSSFGLVFFIYIYTWANTEDVILKNFIDSFIQCVSIEALENMKRLIVWDIGAEKPCQVGTEFGLCYNNLYYKYSKEKCIKNLNILHNEIDEMILTIEKEHKIIVNQASIEMSKTSIPIDDEHVLKKIADYAYPLEKLTINKIKKLGFSESIVKYDTSSVQSIKKKLKPKNIFQKLSNFLLQIFRFILSFFKSSNVSRTNLAG